MSDLPLTHETIESFARAWYRMLDSHARVEDLLKLLSSDGDLEMRFPDATLHSHQDFKSWYETETRNYFDEEHIINRIRVDAERDRADVDLAVMWNSRQWTPPDAASLPLRYDTDQRWHVKKNPRADTLVIVTYSIERFESI